MPDCCGGSTKRRHCQTWGAKCRRTLLAAGYRHVRDTQEDSLYIREMPHGQPAVVIVVYTDDFQITGEEPCAKAVYWQIAKLFQVAGATEAAAPMQEFLGIERVPRGVGVDGVRHVVLHQVKYARFICDDYERRFCAGKRLRGVATPMSTGHDEGEQVPEAIPELKTYAAELVGRLLWLARCTRPDLSQPCNSMARRYRQWERVDDRALHRLFRYLRAYEAVGIGFWGAAEDLHKIIVEVWADSSHAGEVCDARSTSGVVAALRGPKSWLPVGWGSRTQSATALSTPDAELCGEFEGTFRIGLPLAGVAEEVLSRIVRLVLRTDNTTAVEVVRKGYSRKLSYLKKHQRIAISALWETYIAEGSPNVLVEQPGVGMIADPLTKPLDVTVHWRHCRGIGLVAVP